MKDSLIRALAYDGHVRVSAVVTTNVVEEARQRHDTFPTATAALGRVLSSTLLLSWGLKGEGSITLRVFGDGPLGTMIATANAHGEVKGYVNEPQVDLPLNHNGKLDVGGAVGSGHLYISKDIGLREPYTGSVPLITGEIGEDVANYLLTSEQTPSVVAVGVLVNPDYSVAASGGIIIQAMPNAPEEILEALEKGLEHVQSVSSLVQQGLDAKGIIAHYMPNTEVQYLEEKPVLFQCGCSEQRISGLMKSVGQEEIQDILEKEGKSEVVCHFCNEKYQFDQQQLQAILAEIQQEK